MHAGRVHGTNQLASFRRCVLPLLVHSLLRPRLLTFAGTFTGFTASEELALAGTH